MKPKIVLVVWGLFILTFYGPLHDTSIEAKSSLSYDIMMALNPMNADGTYHNQLIRFDFKTLKQTELYAKDSDSVLGILSLSPNGQWLATAQSPSGMREICIFSLDGQLQTCMDDHPRLAFCCDGYYLSDTVTWSADSKYLYFLIEEFGNTKLIETNIYTGRRERVIYEYEHPAIEPIEAYPVIMRWKKDLSLVIVTKPFDVETLVVDTATGLVSDHIFRSESGELLSWKGCYDFSPQDTYLLVHDSLTHIIDFQGIVRTTLDSKFSFCPVWQANEEGFFFYWYHWEEPGIYHYTINGELTLYRTLLIHPSPDSLQPSPDEQYFIFFAHDYVRGGLLFPDGNIMWLSQNDIAFSAIWLPN